MKIKRTSGILLHITSLPGKFGIGDLGRSAYEFVDFMAAAKQKYWQFLSIGPTSMNLDNSPYMSMSAFAGNPLFISPEILQEAGFLTRDDLATPPDFSIFQVEFDKVISFKNKILRKAFTTFSNAGTLSNEHQDFAAFCDRQRDWLDDYALYASLREANKINPWYEWPYLLASREKKSLAQYQRQLADRICYHKFVQFCFFDQWLRLRDYANRKGVSLIGDTPIYVALDSADVWSNKDYFKLNPKTMQPTHVAGVPPDYFSDTGQRWGNPVYRWKSAGGGNNLALFSWWQKRFKHIFEMVDLVRIDHFRAFEASWQIPAHEKTAINGRWVKGPGKFFFKRMQKNLGPLPIIAEDLGFITPAVEKMRDDLAFPGMKVLQFAFDSDEFNPYLPHNYTSTNCVVYTGTHDNNTTIGWYLSDKVSETSRNRARRYTNCKDEGEINWDFIRLAYSSIAAIAVVPLQDILGFGDDCRMNTPSTSNGNWRWRCAPQLLTDDICSRLADETIFYRRAPQD